MMFEKLFSEYSRLKLIEEKAQQIYELAFDHDGNYYLVHDDAMAELGAALAGYRSDI